MSSYYLLMGEIQEEGTTYAAAAGALAPSPFMPPEDAKLTGIRLMPCATAATSLLNGLQVRMSSTSFKPNAIEFGVTGNGLQTVPAFSQPIVDFDIDQVVKGGNKVTIESRNVNGSAVTVECMIFGRFES